jgi:protein-disulfide isomerase
MVKLASGLVAKGAGLDDVTKIVAAYYAGFDRRKKLDVREFGPPVGGPDAKLTFVVISDFTCPFCKLFVPTIEQFVKDRGDRARLFAKPFPIASHPGSGVAAEAAEWAREKGLYWQLQSALYASDETPTADSVAALVSRLGGDAADLRQALDGGRFKQRVASSQVEARDAGLTGTPTLFLNGRRIEDLSEEGLTFALEDEEEWVQHGSWAKD